MWIPTVVAYVFSQACCTIQNIPFFAGGTKTIPQKILINCTSLCIGLFMIQFTVGRVSFLNNISLIEEAFRMGVYSLLVELWFYWTHRALHENAWLYKHVHKEHHLEITPSPIDTYILTPSETVLVTTSFIFPLVSGVQMTLRGLTTVYTTHLIASILIHGGAPRMDHHMIHHSHFNGNYSGTYPMWDNVFGTRIKKKGVKNEKVPLRNKRSMKPIRRFTRNHVHLYSFQRVLV